MTSALTHKKDSGADGTEAVEAHRRKVERAFSRAANSYDDHADVQRRVADTLAARLVEFPLRTNPSYLEIGCGTGFLAESLLRFSGAGAGLFKDCGAASLFTDLSPEMVRLCREKLVSHLPEAGFEVMDGENPFPDERAGKSFDVIASSLVFQWFDDLEKGLGKLKDCLNPGGVLAFASLGADSLKEWRDVIRNMENGKGIAGNPSPYPTLEELSGFFGSNNENGPLSGEMTLTWEERMVREYSSPADFLFALKSIGAQSPVPALLSPSGGPDLSTGDLRKLMSGPGGKGKKFPVTYHILYGVFRKGMKE